MKIGELAGGKAGFHRRQEAHTRQSSLNNGNLDSQVQPHQPPKCPECASNSVWKDGLRKTGNGPVQRYLCRGCGYRFSRTLDPKVKVDIPCQVLVLPETVQNLGCLNSVCGGGGPVDEGLKDSPLPFGEDVASHEFTNVAKTINTLLHNSRERRVRVSEVGAKNLAEVESQPIVGQREATTTSEATVKGKIVEFAWWMQKQGYAPLTITGRSYKIKRLARLGVNLFDPENVKEVIAGQTTWSEGTRRNVAVAYTSFLKMLGREWEAPRYKVPDSLPFIPLESEIDALINGCGRVLACFLQGLKDTGADPGELARLEWTDINHEAKSVTIRHPVKGHNSRVVPVSDAFLGRLNAMPKTGSRVFSNVGAQQSNFTSQRRRIARNHSNPRIMKITFITLRHWKGTMEYHKTKDILHVKNILGHKAIKSTMIYINLESALFQAKSDEFTVRVARTLDEACQLLEVGFDYVTDMEGAKLFRRRK